MYIVFGHDSCIYCKLTKQLLIEKNKRPDGYEATEEEFKARHGVS